MEYRVIECRKHIGRRFKERVAMLIAHWRAPIAETTEVFRPYVHGPEERFRQRKCILCVLQRYVYLAEMRTLVAEHSERGRSLHEFAVDRSVFAKAA